MTPYLLLTSASLEGRWTREGEIPTQIPQGEDIDSCALKTIDKKLNYLSPAAYRSFLEAA